jgi:class 3 adenylate cyclase
VARTETVTVIFTDLVGSTEQASRLGPRGADDLRATHFGLLRNVVAQTGGVEVKNLGDGLMVVFTSLSRALACAVGMQQAVERHNRRGDRESLSIRVGISTGETTVDEDDYFGEAVIEASRLCAIASGGQILATELVKIMAGRHATQEFVPVGELELQGLPERVLVVEVVWEPALATEAQGSQLALPARLTSASTENLFAFFGRVEERTRLAELQKRSSTDHKLQVVLVSGEPGIGKTALVAQAARAAHGLGANVVYGKGEEGLSIPYQPWISALSPLIEAADPRLIDDFLAANGSVLVELVPALARYTQTSQLAAPSDPEVQRFLLMEGISRLLGAASEAIPIVLILDDLHWADAASLQLLTHVVDAPIDMSVLMIGIFRASDLSRNHPLTGVLAALHRQHNIERMELRGLNDTEIIELLEAAAGHPMAGEGVALAHALSRDTEGNPFFVVELLRHLSETGAFIQEEGRWGLSQRIDELDLPRSVREVIGHRIARFGEDVERALSLAAVIGPDFDMGVLVELLGADDNELLDLLDQAMQGGLIAEADNRVDRYRFVHALIRQTLYQDMSASRRQRTHLRIGEILERMGTPDEEQLAALARHWMAATRPSESTKALHYSQRAGDAALEAYAPQDAAMWYSQALELQSQQTSADLRERCSLLLGLATAQRQMGEPEYRDTVIEAGHLALELADAELLTRAATSRDFGQESYSAADDSLMRLLEGALAAVGPRDSSDRARILAALADEMDPRDVQKRVPVGFEAIDIARRLGDEQTLLSVISMVTSPVTTPDTLARRLSESEVAVELSERVGDVATRFAALQLRLIQLAESGDLGNVDNAIAELASIAARTGLPSQRWNLTMLRSWRALLAGHLDEAEKYANECFEVGTKMGVRVAIATYGGQLFFIRLEQGRLAELLDVMRQVYAESPTIPSLRASFAYMDCQLHRYAEAAARFDAEYAQGFTDFPFDATWLNAMTMWSDCAADLGHVEAAADLYDRLLPYRNKFVFLTANDNGFVARPLGRLATLLGRQDEAEHHLRFALEEHRRIDAPYWIARTQLDYADLLGQRGRMNDTALARELIADAHRRVEQHELFGLLERVDRLA